MIAVIFEALPHTNRQHIFADYRLRVAQVIRDYGLNDRSDAPENSRQVHAN